MKVELAEQVVAFVRRLPPGPKQQLRRALRALARGRGDISGKTRKESQLCIPSEKILP
jgi:hypothetical protein